MQRSINSKYTKEFITNINRICTSYTGNKYYVDELIPADKLAIARSVFQIPKTETVIALVDSTVFSGKGDRGLAIGFNGIYWYNDHPDSQKVNISKTLTWNEFATISVKRRKKDVLEIGDGNVLWMFSTCLDGKVLELLLEIQLLVKKTLPTTSEKQQLNTSSSQPIISSTRSSQSYIDALTQICESYSGERYFLGELIPRDKISNARSAFQIPDSETIIALVDSTAFSGKGDRGLVIGFSGIYWYNDFNSLQQKDTGKSLTWSELSTTFIKYKKENILEIGEGNAFYIAKTVLGGKTLKLLLEIQSFIKNNSPTKTLKVEWLITSNGHQFGPYDLSTVESMIASRQINHSECLSWKEGMENWLPFMEVPELRSLVQEPQYRVLVTPPPIAAKPAPPPISSQRLKSLDDVFATTPPNLKKSDERVEAGRVDLNNASLDELLTLPNINQVDAEELIRERDRSIGFETVEQVGHFLELQPHQIERLKKKVVLKPYKGQGSKLMTSARKRVIDF